MTDYLNMSDDELSKLGVPPEEPTTETPVAEPEVVASVVTPEVTEVVVAEVVDIDAGDADPVKEVTPESVVADPKPVVEIPVKEEAKEPVPETVEIDYKAQYEKLLAPFKANGKEMQVTSVEDAQTLMQMGANYNKKMAALKPNLKLMKLLENNGLLSEEKIGFLIDLEKKNPEAINKLIKDSGMDPMDLDAEKASGYKPNTYTVDDREMELDAVLDELQGTPAYNRTLEVVSTKWDASSKQVIASSPQLLKVINNHMQNGIYDTIAKEVESERMFGRLNGLSDIEAYRQVGDAIQARGGFNSVGHPEKTVTQPVVVTPKPKIEDDKLNDKRRAASSTKPAGSSNVPKEYNPLSMSDEEFSKTVNAKYL
jgi:hypothetical protein